MHPNYKQDELILKNITDTYYSQITINVYDSKYITKNSN